MHPSGVLTTKWRSGSSFLPKLEGTLHIDYNIVLNFKAINHKVLESKPINSRLVEEQISEDEKMANFARDMSEVEDSVAKVWRVMCSIWLCRSPMRSRSLLWLPGPKEEEKRCSL